MKSGKLSTKINLTIILSCVLLSLLYGVILYLFEMHRRESSLDKVKLLVEATVKQKFQDFANEMAFDLKDSLEITLQEMGRVKGVMAVAAYDGRGRLILYTGKPPKKHLAAIKGHSAEESARFSQERGLEGESVLTYFSPIIVVGERIGYLKTWYSLASLTRETHFALGLFAVLLVAMILVVVLILRIMLTRFVANPVSVLGEAMKAVREGNVEHRVEIASNDEMGDIATAFNEMSDRLEVSLREAAQSNIELQKKIEEEIHSAEALRISQEKFSKAFKRSPVWVTITTIDQGRCLEANDAFLKAMGYSREEVVDHTTEELDSWVNREDRRRIVDTVKAHGSVFNQEVEHRTKSDKVLTILQSSESIEIGGRDCLLSVSMDVTERKRAEKELLAHREHLEELVAERTTALKATNEELQGEIDERQRAEAELRESERRNRALLEATPDSVAVYDPQGNTLYVNPGFEQTFGWSKEEVLNKTVDFLPPHEVEKVRDAVKKVVKGESVIMDGQRYTKDGGLVDIQLSSAPILGDEGNYAGCVVISRDISERKRAENALSESRARLQASIDSSADAIAFSSKDRVILDCNQAFTAMFGHSREDLIGSSWNLVHVDREHFERCGKTIYLSVGESGFWRGEWPFRHKDGTIVPADVTLSEIRLPDGTVEGYVGMLRDITERRKAEEAIRDSEQRLAEAQSIASLGNWNWYIETDELWWSEEVSQIFGLDTEKNRGSSEILLNTVHPDDREKFNRAISKAIREGQPYKLDFRLVRPNGEERVVNAQGRVFHNERGQAVRQTGTVQDITERKEMEKTLESAKEMAIRANEAKSDFLARMSHEIRTPMNAVVGMTHLAMKTELTPKQRDYLGKIRSSADAL
ncbi:MAG: PAS domain S-box protein, partial [Proteobacteria bacterium]|nr:PAS domain S-box protein [Pseudomonadota bacterium]